MTPGVDLGELPAVQEAERLSQAARVCSVLWLEPPPPQLAALLQDRGALANWPLLDEISQRGVKILRQSPAVDLETLLEQCRSEHLRLFGAAGKTLVQGNESVWLSREHLAFGEQTLQVRQFYKRWGLQVPAGSLFPDDYLGWQLHFLSQLLDLAQARFALPEAQRETWGDVQTSGPAAVPLSEVLRDLSDFTRAHAGRFFTKATGQLREQTTFAPYLALAEFTDGFFTQLQCFLATVNGPESHQKDVQEGGQDSGQVTSPGQGHD